MRAAAVSDHGYSAGAAQQRGYRFSSWFPAFPIRLFAKIRAVCIGWAWGLKSSRWLAAIANRPAACAPQTQKKLVR